MVNCIGKTSGRLKSQLAEDEMLCKFMIHSDTGGSLLFDPMNIHMSVSKSIGNIQKNVIPLNSVPVNLIMTRSLTGSLHQSCISGRRAPYWTLEYMSNLPFIWDAALPHPIHTQCVPSCKHTHVKGHQIVSLCLWLISINHSPQCIMTSVHCLGTLLACSHIVFFYLQVLTAPL